jgi:osomolarity two-component system sensor histidine kinase SLN1
VTLAKDGQEALERIREAMNKGESFGVVLMDIQMPRMDGLQCTRIARKLGYNAPIIALTAFADEGNKAECLEAGMNDFLPKPIDKLHLRQVLKACTGIGSFRSGSEIGLPTPPLSTVNPTPPLSTYSSVSQRDEGRL